jgi:hypothetical protein
MNRKNKITALAVAVLWIAQSATAFASTEITLTVKNPDPYTGNQSWFVYEKNPGDVINDTASIKNFGDEPAIVRIYPVDAATNPGGSFILKFDHEKQAGIGAWTEVQKKEMLIQPGERIDMPFTISVPGEIAPGQYIGGIVIEYGKAGADSTDSASCQANNICSASVSVKTRIGSRIYLNIPGTASENVTLTDFQYGQTITGGSQFKFKIENNGNIPYEPKAEIAIFDSFGKLYDTLEKPLGLILPGTITEPVVAWDKKAPLIGNFRAIANVTFYKRYEVSTPGLHGAAQSITKNVSFMITPWGPILFALVVTAGFFTYFAMQKYQFKKILAGCEKYEVTENEDLVSIAEKKNVNWEFLAHINRLKPPYVVRKGHVIYVPTSPEQPESTEQPHD